MVLALFTLFAAYSSVLIEDVPHVEQRPDFCGEACAEMWLKKLKRDVDQNAVFSASGVDPALGRGAVTNELAHGLGRLGFDVGRVWTAHRPRDAEASIEREWRALHADLLRGIPSIVCMHYADEPGTTEHFRLILGYGEDQDEVIYHEPAEVGGAYRRMSRALFLKLWTFKPRPTRWTTIRMRLEAKEVIAPPLQQEIEDAEYAQRIMEVRERLHGERAAISVERPFVLIDDGDDADVRSHRERVHRTIELLKKDFFAKAPSEIVDVWIFKNEKSYRRHSKSLFDDEPDTPYGYYSSEDHALVMNIGPGYGTLTHELVHPFVHASFPACPPWINEGLASLYERPAERDGHLIGLVNWRLRGLKQAIARGALPTIEALAAMDEKKFYDDDSATNYAFARYLLFTLQERGDLLRFMREVQASTRDRTGFTTLKAVLGEDDMTRFQREWESACTDRDCACAAIRR